MFKPKTHTVKTDQLVSAFQNEIDWNKVDEYTEIMKSEMMSHSFPPINGFWSVIDESDVENGVCFLTRGTIEYQDIGKKMWKVTDGHHRSIAAIMAGLPSIEAQWDFNCITSDEERSLYFEGKI